MQKNTQTNKANCVCVERERERDEGRRGWLTSNVGIEEERVEALA